jgi:hypothetical protein
MALWCTFGPSLLLSKDIWTAMLKIALKRNRFVVCCAVVSSLPRGLVADDDDDDAAAAEPETALCSMKLCIIQGVKSKFEQLRYNITFL